MINKSSLFRILRVSAILGAAFSFNLSLTILTIALPAIGKELDVGTNTIGWVSVAPMLATAVLSPLGGTFSDTFGPSFFWYFGLIFALVAIGFSAISSSFLVLLAFRIITGVALAMHLPSGFALMLSYYPKSERQKPTSFWTVSRTLGPTMGVLLGGIIIDSFSWRSLFWMQIPSGILAVIVALFSGIGRKQTTTPIEEGNTNPGGDVEMQQQQQQPPPPPPNDNNNQSFHDKLQRLKKIDFIGISLLGSCVLFFLLAVNQGSSLGWLSWEILLCLALSSLLLILFILAQRFSKLETPLVPRSIRHDWTIAILVSVYFMVNGAYMGAFMIMPFLFTNIYHYSSSQSSFIMVIRPFAMTCAATILPKISRNRFLNPFRSIVLGTILVALSLFSFCLINEETPLWYLLVGMTIQGIGLGFVSPSCTALISLRVEQKFIATVMSLVSMLQIMSNSVGMISLTSILVGGGGVKVLNGYLLAFACGTIVSSLPLLLLAIPPLIERKNRKNEAEKNAKTTITRIGKGSEEMRRSETGDLPLLEEIATEEDDDDKSEDEESK